MATKGVRCSYEEIIDLHTESDKVTAIGIHTPTGEFPRKMFSGFFDMYKKYKYLGCSIKFVPVARLPADPLQVSYGAGDTIDPRDLANPLMFHGCHGDDMGTILNKLYGDDNSISDSVTGLESDNDATVINSTFYDAMERLYYKALTDRTWKKAGAQRGFIKKGLRPMVYSLATNRQIMPGSLIPNAMGLDAAEDNDGIDLPGGDPISAYDFTNDSGDFTVSNAITHNNIQMFTPRLTTLGWMDTRNVITVPYSDEQKTDGDFSDAVQQSLTKGFINQINYAQLPKIYMGVILMAPAYKTEQYYRMIIKHYFAFKQFRGISFRPEVTGVPTYVDANTDLFGFETDGVTFPDIPIDPLEGD